MSEKTREKINLTTHADGSTTWEEDLTRLVDFDAFRAHRRELAAEAAAWAHQITAGGLDLNDMLRATRGASEALDGLVDTIGITAEDPADASPREVVELLHDLSRYARETAMNVARLTALVARDRDASRDMERLVSDRIRQEHAAPGDRSLGDC